MKPEEAKRGNEQKGTVSKNESNKVGRKMNVSKTRELRELRERAVKQALDRRRSSGRKRCSEGWDFIWRREI